VQRLFSMFPSGWPGIALLLLRISVAITAILDVMGGREWSGWAVGALVVLCANLCLGFLTPIMAVIVFVGHIALSGVRDLHGTAGLVVILLNTLALALLGPGAYSIDSRRFGRRVVDLPPG